MAPFSPYFVVQSLAQGLASSTIQTNSSLGLNQTPIPIISSSLAKDFVHTLPFKRNTLNTNPSQTTTWKPTFGASPIPKNPLNQPKPLTLHESTSTSTYWGTHLHTTPQVPQVFPTSHKVV